MRTTLNLDDDVLSLARTLAESRKISLGEAVSYLALRGATQPTPVAVKDGFPLFSVEPSIPQLGLEEIQKAEDTEDHEYGCFFRKAGE